MDLILEKLFLAKIKGLSMTKKNFFALVENNLIQFSFSVVLRLRGIILPPPIKGQSKISFYKTFIFKDN
jgi:hypothetical protein